MLRFISLLLLAGWSVLKLGNWLLGLFCSIVFIIELFFIEIIERKRADGAIHASIKEIGKKMRELDKSLLSGAIDIESLYSVVLTKLVFKLLFFCRILGFQYHRQPVICESLETAKSD